MGLDRLAVVHRRMHEQRLAAEPFDTPAQVVGWLGAVQAQEHAEAKWSIAERTHACTAADVEEAFARGGTADPPPASHLALRHAGRRQRRPGSGGRRAGSEDATLFTSLSDAQAAALDAAVERFGAFAELPAVLELSPP